MKNKKTKGVVPFHEDPDTEVTCIDCKGVYKLGEFNSCPHCFEKEGL